MTDTVWGAVGIFEVEGQVFEALAARGQATVADLAAELEVTRSRVSRMLAKLVERGLASQLPGRPARFAAVMPDIAASALIAAQESKLRQLRDHAQQLAAARRVTAGSRHPSELLEVIEGSDNVSKAFVRLQRDARTEMRVFDKPPYAADQPDGNIEEYRLLSEGRVRYRAIYDRASLTQPERMAGIWNSIRRGERARVAGSLPMKMALCDDQMALIPVASNIAAQAVYLLHPSSLLDALSELFETMWNKAVPFTPKVLENNEKDILTDQDRELLSLLAAGVTDETIARTLGWNVRTVRRHIRRIASLTGAETRFQAGMEASRRGWV